MIVRSDEKPDIKAIRAFWFKIHRAKIVNIKKVYDKTGMANYISDQRMRNGMAVEMSSQARGGLETIERWRMSKGWVPKAFMKKFGQFYYKYGNRLDDLTLQELVRDWVIETSRDYEYINFMPKIIGNEIKWSEKICQNQ